MYVPYSPYISGSAKKDQIKLENSYLYGGDPFLWAFGNVFPKQRPFKNVRFSNIRNDSVTIFCDVKDSVGEYLPKICIFVS